MNLLTCYQNKLSELIDLDLLLLLTLSRSSVTSVSSSLRAGREVALTRFCLISLLPPSLHLLPGQPRCSDHSLQAGDLQISSTVERQPGAPNCSEIMMVSPAQAVTSSSVSHTFFCFRCSLESFNETYHIMKCLNAVEGVQKKV